MPWDAQGKWIVEDDSAATRLSSLLNTSSPYMTQARQAGMRTAHKRGLLNSSIAAGAAEASAISAAAPIASQDAAQTATRNQAVLEGGITRENTLAAQAQNIEGNKAIQAMQDQAAMERAQLEVQGATEHDLREFDQRTKEQLATIASNERLGLLTAETQKSTVGSTLSGAYLDAFAALAANPDVPADARNAYMAEFKRVMEQGYAIAGLVVPPSVTWDGGTATPPGSAPTGTPVYQNGQWTIA